jgi:hypothetical protein
VAFVELLLFQKIQTNIHLGFDVSNMPHVWVRIIFTDGDVYDVDPTQLDNWGTNYYQKIK